MTTEFMPLSGFIDIYSSQGTFIVNAENGEIFDALLNEDAPENYFEIVKFDLIEARQNGVNSFDILNFGYWIGEIYTPPAQDWRDEIYAEYYSK